MSEWWKGACIYQIYPRSFLDSNHDGIGDLKGIIQKLDYIAKLGVDAVWISPFFTSPMKDFGYDVSNYRDIDPIFGTLQDFKTLLDKAHSLNIKIIIDLVLSHTSDSIRGFMKNQTTMYGPMPRMMEVRLITGFPFLAAAHGNGMTDDSNTTFTIS